MEIISSIMTRVQFQAAVEDLFGVPPGSLKDTDSRDTIDTWSSLEDLNLLALIRTELGLEAGADVVQVETVGELMALLTAKGALKG
jgi:hypothetical protein